jgi:hypothetical protein
MIEKLDGSSGPIVGYKVVGKVTAEDYETLVPEVEALVEQYDDDVCMLIDLGVFDGEEIKAWLPDMKFGIKYHNKIDRMAIVGDKKWQEWMTHLCKPFFADDAKFFHSADIDDAWAWVRDED